MRIPAAFALLALLIGGANAQNTKPAEVWFTAAHIELTATSAATGLAAEWQFDRADNGDVRLGKNERRAAGNVKGNVLSLCDDRALVFKEIVPARGRELSEFNDPILHLQLVLRLLARAMPEGLPPAGADVALDTGDEKSTLRLRKAYSARKDIGAPWRARGNARRTGPELRFDLTLSYAGDTPPYGQQELKLAGLWSQQARMGAFDNGLNIADSRVHRVDTISEVVGGNTLFDEVANPTPQKFATLGELRAAIGRNWDRNTKAAQIFACRS